MRDRWLTALRSGEYAQGRAYLAYVRDGEVRYCCLGVLCELAVADGVIQREDTSWLADGRIGYAYDGKNSLLPFEVVSWAGLTSNNPTARVGGDDGESVKQSLAWLNDHGRSFEAIATLIEEQL